MRRGILLVMLATFALGLVACSKPAGEGARPVQDGDYSAQPGAPAGATTPK